VVVAGTTPGGTYAPSLYLTAAYYTAPQPSPAQQLAWTSTHGEPNTPNVATDMVLILDRLGNDEFRAYVTGYFNQEGDHPEWDDWFTVELSTVDGSEAWTNMPNGGIVYHGPLSDRPVKIVSLWRTTADGHGTFYVTGFTQNLAGDSDILTIKYYDGYISVLPEWTGKLQPCTDPGCPTSYLGGDDQPTAMSGLVNVGQDVLYVCGWRTNPSGNNDYVTAMYTGDDPPQFDMNKNPSWLIFHPLNPNEASLDDVAASNSFTVVTDETGTHLNVFVTGRSNGGTSGDDFLTKRYRDGDH
jgi:hypothetical protein